MAVLDEKFDEIEAFKEKEIKAFLKKHGLKPKDVLPPDRLNVSGYVLHVDKHLNLSSINEQGEDWGLTLYKVVDSTQFHIKRKIIFVIKPKVRER